MATLLPVTQHGARLRSEAMPPRPPAGGRACSTRLRGRRAAPGRPGMSEAERSPRPNLAVRHAAAVLGAFSAGEPSLGVNEIARRVRLNRSSVSRLLQTLEELGFVARRQPGGQYRLGLRLAELAGIALASFDLRDVA